jgi:hypothetical protein
MDARVERDDDVLPTLRSQPRVLARVVPNWWVCRWGGGTAAGEPRLVLRVHQCLHEVTQAPKASQVVHLITQSSPKRLGQNWRVVHRRVAHRTLRLRL